MIASRDEVRLVSTILNKPELTPGVTLSPDEITNPLVRKAVAHKLTSGHSDFIGLMSSFTYSSDEEDQIKSWCESKSSLKTATEVQALCGKIRKHTRQVFVIRMIQEMGSGIKEGADVDDMVSLFNKNIMRSTSTGYVTIREAIEAQRKEILNAKENGLDHLFVKTGFAEYDHYYLGLEKGRLTIIAGRPGMGKSAIALQLIEQASLRSNVGVHTLEMSNGAIVNRMISRKAKLDIRAIKSGQIEMGAKFDAQMEELSLLNIHLDDTSRQSLEHITAAAHKLKYSDQGLDMIVVDYIGIMDKGAGKEGLNEKLGLITAGLRQLAKDLNIAVVVLSQLNRDVEKRADKRPMASDLKGSGDIEQDADTILLLYRPIVYDKDADPQATELIIAKHRDAPLSTIPLRFNAPTTTFISDFAPGID